MYQSERENISMVTVNETKGIIPFLTFSGQAKEAMDYYISIFPDSKLLSLDYIKKDDRGIEGKVLNGTFKLMNQTFMVMDIEEKYSAAFSWSTSFFIQCPTEEDFDKLFDKLSDGGIVMMGPEPIYNLRKVAWVTDKFSIIWQLVWK